MKIKEVNKRKYNKRRDPIVGFPAAERGVAFLFLLRQQEKRKVVVIPRWDRQASPFFAGASWNAKIDGPKSSLSEERAINIRLLLDMVDESYASDVDLLEKS